MKKTLIFIIVICILGALGWLWLGNGQKTSGSQSIIGTSTAESFTTSTPELDKASLAERDAAIATISTVPLTETYVNTVYGFGLKYPKGLKPTSFASPDGNGDVVLIADLKTGVGMQILITPFGGTETSISADMVRQNVPDIQVISPQDVIVGKDGKGIAFIDGGGVGANRQIWFVSGKHLYQITAPIGFDDTLKNIMNTWAFKS